LFCLEVVLRTSTSPKMKSHIRVRFQWGDSGSTRWPLCINITLHLHAPVPFIHGCTSLTSLKRRVVM
jgi:hypothetical protein